MNEERKMYLHTKWTPAKIKMLRAFSGLSQVDFCKVVNISQASVSHYERGRNVKTELLEKIESFSVKWKEKRLSDLEKEIEFTKTF